MVDSPRFTKSSGIDPKKALKFCQPRMKTGDRNIYSIKCHICITYLWIVGGIVLTPLNSRRGWHRRNFVKGPTACARGENMSRPITGLQRGQYNSHQAFTVRRKKKKENIFFFSERAASRCSKAFLYKVSRKYYTRSIIYPGIRRIDYLVRRTNIK